MVGTGAKSSVLAVRRTPSSLSDPSTMLAYSLNALRYHIGAPTNTPAEIRGLSLEFTGLGYGRSPRLGGAAPRAELLF